MLHLPLAAASASHPASFLPTTVYEVAAWVAVLGGGTGLISKFVVQPITRELARRRKTSEYLARHEQSIRQQAQDVASKLAEHSSELTRSVDAQNTMIHELARQLSSVEARLIKNGGSSLRDGIEEIAKAQQRLGDAFIDHVERSDAYVVSLNEREREQNHMLAAAHARIDQLLMQLSGYPGPDRRTGAPLPGELERGGTE